MTHIDSQKLKTIINEKDWDQLLQNIKPKHFVRQESKMILDASILAQICQVLVSETTPVTIIILCLKCLGNSCLDSYKHKQHTIENVESIKYSKNLYNKLVESDVCKQRKNCDYPHDSYFPYDGVIEWTVDYIKIHGKSIYHLTDNELDILRLSIQFLCNLFTYACPNITEKDIRRYLNCDNLKQAILSCMQSDNRLLANAACIYVHNALKKLCQNYFTMEKKDLFLQLFKPAREGFTSAKDALLFLLHQPNVFEDVYNNITMNEKLDLLKIIYDEVWNAWQSDFNTVFTENQAEFLALTFCKKSDLILKTVDTYVNNIDPTEIILILNILGLLTTQYKIVENIRSLLINCKYLLMSLHMMGKEADNYFTPITNLSQVVPNTQRRSVNICSNANDTEVSGVTAANHDLQEHPAYGFKAGLIQVIANVVHRNKMCQDLFREIDGIPLLLDCCNIDARNPLILQWAILALRNLCEGNPENQEIIRNCEKTGVPDNPALQEMGLTLHEDADGKSIRIAPLRRN
ncbi:PREDICTED: ataxin-10 [Cyphomyrmex costatus]|uniref:Ataxin-10 n=1 Tax=Cyphomyrmex costatus TaxID=456900 RepID=A0A151IK77_9HYME|nr:PREDICTED: ataxin-10 [Cyphomyrmex costatus]KYN04673.1 Ataxin-10 [Cyphomyrmex costatus]